MLHPSAQFLWIGGNLQRPPLGRLNGSFLKLRRSLLTDENDFIASKGNMRSNDHPDRPRAVRRLWAAEADASRRVLKFGWQGLCDSSTTWLDESSHPRFAEQQFVTAQVSNAPFGHAPPGTAQNPQSGSHMPRLGGARAMPLQF